MSVRNDRCGDTSYQRSPNPGHKLSRSPRSSSEERRIGWMAEENGARMIPHGWNTAVGLAADLQLASALPKTDLVEYISGSAYVDDIAADGWKLDAKGLLPIPEAPGLGLELDVDAVSKYSGG